VPERGADPLFEYAIADFGSVIGGACDSERPLNAMSKVTSADIDRGAQISGGADELVA
jgi:hypothetical protein